MTQSPATDATYALFESEEGRRVDDIAKRLQDLLSEAHKAGVVITVELEPLQPLAMRNYRMHGYVRGAR